MKNLRLKSIAFASILLLSVFIFSCNKKQDTTAKIYVRNSAGELVSGATVRLYGQGSPPPPGATVTLDKKATTNSAGEAIFDLNEVFQQGQAGVAVLNIDVTNGSDSGTGVIKVEQETVSEETVFI